MSFEPPGRPWRRKDSGGGVRDTLKRRFAADVVGAFDRIKFISKGGYLLKLVRPSDANGEGGQQEIKVKWHAPLDHPTSDWIGIWSVAGKAATKGRTRAEHAPAAPCGRQLGVTDRCWSFVPRGRKGIVVFSGSKLPRCEGKYRINYVIDGDPWSPEQTIAHHGPEFSMVAEDKQDYSAESHSPGYNSASTAVFHLSLEGATTMSEEDRQQAWRDEWIAAVDESDKARVLAWESRRCSVKLEISPPEEVSQSDSSSADDESSEEDGARRRRINLKEKRQRNYEAHTNDLRKCSRSKRKTGYNEAASEENQMHQLKLAVKQRLIASAPSSSQREDQEETVSSLLPLPQHPPSLGSSSDTYPTSLTVVGKNLQQNAHSKDKHKKKSKQAAAQGKALSPTKSTKQQITAHQREELHDPEDVFGLHERYYLKWGRLSFSEDFLFYALIIILVVFLMIYNAIYYDPEASYNQ